MAFEELGLEVLDVLSGSEIADNAGQLKALAKLAPDQRLTTARGLADGSHKSVKDYLVAVGGGNRFRSILKANGSQNIRRFGRR